MYFFQTVRGSLCTYLITLGKCYSDILKLDILTPEILKVH